MAQFDCQFNNKTKKKSSALGFRHATSTACLLVRSDFLLVMFFDAKERTDNFCRKFWVLLPKYTALRSEDGMFSM
jgi:hypothetical protein